MKNKSAYIIVDKRGGTSVTIYHSGIPHSDPLPPTLPPTQKLGRDTLASSTNFLSITASDMGSSTYELIN